MQLVRLCFTLWGFGAAQVERAKLCLDEPSHWVAGMLLLLLQLSFMLLMRGFCLWFLPHPLCFFRTPSLQLLHTLPSAAAVAAGVQLLNSLNLDALCDAPPWQQPQLQQQSLQLLLLKAKLLHRLHAANEPQQHPGLSREGVLPSSLLLLVLPSLLLLVLSLLRHLLSLPPLLTDACSTQ